MDFSVLRDSNTERLTPRLKTAQLLGTSLKLFWANLGQRQADEWCT
jgi:hypothetical protein